jgi:hypothetical protein
MPIQTFEPMTKDFATFVQLCREPPLIWSAPTVHCDEMRRCGP